MKFKEFCLVLLIILFSSSCLQKQKHKIEHPEWPRFDLGGYVVDTLTGDSIAGALLELEYTSMAYPDTDSVFQTQAISDSSGFFVFHKIPVGAMYLHKYHSNYCSIEPDLVQLPHSDRYDVVIKMVERRYLNICGYVYNSLSLTPMRDVEVKVIYAKKFCEDDSSSSVYTTFTNEEGFFEFQNLPQGAGAVKAYRLAYFPAYLNFTLFDQDMDTLYFYLVPIP